MFEIIDSGRGLGTEAEEEEIKQVMQSNYNEKNYFKNNNLGLKIAYRLTGLLGP